VTDLEAHDPDRTPLAEQQAVLSSDLTSAAQARRVVRQILQDVARDEWCDSAELAVSEVVTNSVLHARTEIEVRVGVYPDEVCVEVRDHSSTLPSRRDYDTEATTGRGMGLVAALARAYGVRSLGEHGKVVWFCIGDTDEVDPDALLAAWDIEATEPPRDDRCVEVLLRSIPATLWLAARQHHDAILRELTFWAIEHESAVGDIGSADSARSLVSTALAAALDRARAQGTARPPVPDGYPSPLPWGPDSLDLVVPVPADAGGAFAALQDVLDLAERLAVDGELFTRPGLPEIVAVRDWVCDQVIAQLAGVSPAPWPGTAQQRFETDVNDRADRRLPDWDDAVVTGARGPVVAADDANRILAVSPALAEMLGWEADDLVGRRVVTLIPPQLREAHVAGFSRHLSTGEAHVLGVPLDLPVLARDGREVMCTFLVEQAPTTTGRAVYLAWLDPLPSPNA